MKKELSEIVADLVASGVHKTTIAAISAPSTRWVKQGNSAQYEATLP